MLSPPRCVVAAGSTFDSEDEFARRLAAELGRCKPRIRTVDADAPGNADEPPLRDDFSDRLAARLRQANRDRLGARSAVAARRGPPASYATDSAVAGEPQPASAPTVASDAGSVSQSAGALPRDLARVVAAWPRLTPQVRGAILSLVDRR